MLYCNGEAWFNARKYNTDLSVLLKMENVFQSSIEQLMKSALLNKQAQTNIQTRVANDTFLTRLQQIPLLNALGKFFTPLTTPVFNILEQLQQQVRQQAQRPLNPLQQLSLRIAAVLLSFASAFSGRHLSSIRESDEDKALRKRDEEADAEAYADKFIRRSQASNKSMTS